MDEPNQGGIDDAPPDLRLGHHALALLEAARGIGDPALVAQAEAMAVTAGLVLAERIRREPEGREA